MDLIQPVLNELLNDPEVANNVQNVMDDIKMFIKNNDFYSKNSNSIIIREITEADYPILEDFIYHSIFTPPGVELPLREIIFEPEIFIYIDGFGSKNGDFGVVAETDGKIVGAAWTRIIPGFGHIDNETPELAISILPDYRGQGIGAKLMELLFDILYERGYKQTSLAVQQANDAVKFYLRLWYEVIDRNEEEFIMVKHLYDKNATLDDIADESGGYVDYCPDPNEKFGFDKAGFEAYCRLKGKDALDMTVREQNIFIFERKRSKLELENLPDTNISYDYRRLSRLSEEKGIQPVDLTLRELQQFYNRGK
jgi:ribosomal protein S18 acetylase RimI-like enzyme